MCRFDAYTATTNAARAPDVVCLLMREIDDTIHESAGFYGFKERLWIGDRAGDQVASVQYGGLHGDLIMVEVKGERSPPVVDAIRANWEHRCTRVDSCVDFDEPDVFKTLLEIALQVKAEHRLFGEKRGDWDFPELGRTQYLGAPSSAITARLYEKGKEPGYRHLDRPNLTRLELQVRPTKVAKGIFSTLSALEVWGASKWTRQLAAAVLRQQLHPRPPGTIRKATLRDQKLRSMMAQYGAHVASLARELGGWDPIGPALNEMRTLTGRSTDPLLEEK